MKHMHHDRSPILDIAIPVLVVLDIALTGFVLIAGLVLAMTAIFTG